VVLNEQFRPAYYEDTDLAMRLRHSHDAAVDYNPFAVAVASRRPLSFDVTRRWRAAG